MLKLDRIEDHDGLLIIAGTNTCLGYLLVVPAGIPVAASGHTADDLCFDAEHGLVDGMTAARAELHNRVFDEAVLKGLDEGCQVGQGNYFYLEPRPLHVMWRPKVRTWLGTVVSDDVTVRGRGVTFRRGGRVFAGKKAATPAKDDESAIWFVRTQ